MAINRIVLGFHVCVVHFRHAGHQVEAGQADVPNNLVPNPRNLFVHSQKQIVNVKYVYIFNN